MHFPLRSRQLRLSLLASSLLIAMSAQGREKVNVDLPAAPLGEAINALAQQSSVQIIFASDLGAGRNAPAVKGRFTPEEALQTLLKDTGLQVQAKDERTFVIVAQGALHQVLESRADPWKWPRRKSPPRAPAAAWFPRRGNPPFSSMNNCRSCARGQRAWLRYWPRRFPACPTPAAPSPSMARPCAGAACWSWSTGCRSIPTATPRATWPTSTRH